MNIEQRINAFTKLGSLMLNAAAGESNPLSEGLIAAIETCRNTNPWFTPVNVRRALVAHGGQLNRDNITAWLSRYPDIDRPVQPRTVALIMAGNIPAVGFHDMLCVLITGNRADIRLSSKDDMLVRALASLLTTIEPRFAKYISFTDGLPEKFDMVIATGSDNTSRYFEYYFGRFPCLIRRNRTGAAILDGTETDSQLEALGEDVFSYFGLGCRNVTKIYVPPGYNLQRLTGSWARHSEIAGNRKYTSGYNYQKAVLTINNETFTDTGFALLKRDKALFSPVSVINYDELATDVAEMELDSFSDKIQVVAGARHTPFGFAQKPKLWDYSDGIDTLSFLSK